MSDSFYRAFEDRYRGSREVITSRLRAYLPFVIPLLADGHSATAIDLGCGRGEWLELLRSTAFQAYGVDLDEGMLAACRERGLDAKNADAIKTLQELPTNSVALISAFHVVEHIPFDDVQLLIREALRALQPGGLLILETPNPENLVVGTSSFYMDPSHERPIPLELLSFAVEHAGYQRVCVLRLQEPEELHTERDVGLSSVLNGVSPDYGLVAQKYADADLLAKFDVPFQTSYGITLDTLTRRYDFQASRRISDLHDLLAQMETRAVGRTSLTADRISLLEDRVGHAEARAEQIAGHLLDMLHSRSWRVTAPLRFATATLIQLKTDIAEASLLQSAKRRIKSFLRRLKRIKAGQPIFKKSESAPQNLSPRAARIYIAIKKAIEARKN